MGMIHHLGSYLSNLNSVTGPLNDLLKASRQCTWDVQQVNVFQKAKQLAASTPVPSYYDVKRPVTVCADAGSCEL